MASQVESIKRVPGTPFIVDGFRFQSSDCRHYFLTHAHSDHTTGLSRSFCAGTIYCTPITAAVLQLDIGLPPGLVHPLALDERVIIAGVEVTPMDANHCPGACMFLFRVPAEASLSPGAGGGGRGGRAQVVLHTGDLRWHPRMASHPALQADPVHTLILDTTYCAPKWVFPPQEEAVGQIVDLMQREAAANPATLFVMGSYHIGKERAYLGAAHQLGWKVHCPPAKRKLLRVLGLPSSWLALLAEDPNQAPIHVLGMGEQLHEQALAERIRGTRWERVVAIRPTGWSYKRSGGLTVRVSGCVVTVGVPYSEHSSFEELRGCVRALKPRRIIPTVNASDPRKARALVDLLADCMDLSADKSRLDAYFRRGTHSTPSVPPALPQGQPPPTSCTAAAPREVGGVDFEGEGEEAPAQGRAGHAASLAGELSAAVVVGLSWCDARQSGVWRMVPSSCPSLSAAPAAAAVAPVAAAPAAAALLLGVGIASPSLAAPVDGRGECSQAGGCEQQQQEQEQQLQQGQIGCATQGAGTCPSSLVLPRPGLGLSAALPLQRSTCNFEQGSWDLSIDLGSGESEGEASMLSGGAGAKPQQAPHHKSFSHQELASPLEAMAGQTAAAGDTGRIGSWQESPSGVSAEAGQAGRHGGHEGGAAASSEGFDGELVDLSRVDVREQERLLAAIARARAAGAVGLGGQRQQGPRPGQVGSASKLRQGSLRSFLGIQRK